MSPERSSSRIKYDNYILIDFWSPTYDGLILLWNSHLRSILVCDYYENNNIL